MQDCDTTLKGLLMQSAATLLRLLGVPGEVREWLNIELPRVRNQRVDLLLELTTGEILHIELQSGNDPDMPLRMLDYATAIRRRCRNFPRQVVLYVGNQPLRMSAGLRAPGIDYHYHLIDIREIDSDSFLESSHIAENLLSVLARNADPARTIRSVMRRIGLLPPGEREDALRTFLILSGMRGLAAAVEHERTHMPVTFDIMDNEVLGPVLRRGLEQGREEGQEQGTRMILLAMLQRRFGALPPWAEARLAAASPTHLHDLALRLLDAKTLEELFSNPA